MRLVDLLIAYDESQVTQDEEVALFEHLVETGVCWQLSGHYQRVAATLIEAGLIKPAERVKLPSSERPGLLRSQNNRP